MIKKKEQDKCEDCKKYQQKAFELEVDEDLQQERLNQFWQKYRWLIYIGIVLILGATAGIQLYQSWRMKIRLAESDDFEQAVVKIYSQQPEEAKPILTHLAANGRTGYKYLAHLELAGLAARQNDTQTALSELKNVIDSDAPKSLRTVATLSYVGQQVDTGNIQELLPLVQPFLKDSSFVGVAAELAVILHVRANQPQEAQKVLEDALALPNLSETNQLYLKTLSQMVESK